MEDAAIQGALLTLLIERKQPMTSTLLVRSQDELDKALADGVADLRIEHPLGRYLTIADDPGFWLTLRGNSHATLSRFTVARLHSPSAKATGVGHVIDVTDAVLSAPDAWAEYHGVEVINGIATVYKALHDHYGTDRPEWRGAYAPGKAPEAPDWRDDASCGGGLHFSPTPRQASDYLGGATRWVKVGVELATLRPILGDGAPKCKAPKVVVPCVEVDINGDPVEPVIGE